MRSWPSLTLVTSSWKNIVNASGGLLWACWSCFQTSCRINVNFSAPCYLFKNVQWSVRAQHLVVARDGIRFVRDQRPTCYGLGCTDAGQQTKTISLDKITSCEVVDSGRNDLGLDPEHAAHGERGDREFQWVVSNVLCNGFEGPTGLPAARAGPEAGVPLRIRGFGPQPCCARSMTRTTETPGPN